MIGNTQISQQLIKIVIKQHTQQLFINQSQQIDIRELTGGQINYVYEINGKFVIKIEKDIDVLNYQAQILQKALQHGVKVPKVYTTGFHPQLPAAAATSTKSRNNYIIMQKLEGVTLSRLYKTNFIEFKAKQSIIKQLCSQMKILHDIKFNQYWINGVQHPTLLSALDSLKMFACIEENNQSQQMYKHIFIGSYQKYKNIALKLKQYYENNRYIFLEEDQQPCLVHNDLHFCNILVNEHNFLEGIIDFDFSRRVHPDYQLFRILCFFIKPQYYVEQGQQQIWRGTNFSEQMSIIIQNYPQLFSSKYLHSKIRIYFIEQIMNDLENQCYDAVDCWYQTLFESDWLENMVRL